MEKGIQRGETQEIPWRTNPGGLRQDTYSKALKINPGLQSPVLLKMGGRRKYAIKCGLRLMPEIYEKLNPMPYGDAQYMEVDLAIRLPLILRQISTWMPISSKSKNSRDHRFSNR